MTIPLRVALFLLFSTSFYAQALPASVFTSGDLQADALILRSAYEKLHPGLYRYHSKAEMDAEFAALNRQLGHDQTLQSAFLIFSEFTATIRCGHTQLNPLNQSKSVVEALFKRPQRVPFYFTWLNREMVVTRDLTARQTLPRGTQVISVNGEPTANILAKLLTIARADGANDGKRIAQLAVNGTSEYEPFDLYYPLFFPPQSRDLDLIVKKPKGGKAERVSVESLTVEQRVFRSRIPEEQHKDRDDALFEWTYFQNGTAYVRMPTWALYNTKWNWESWIHQHIDQAAERKAPALILDLRGNEGGNDVGSRIIAHLIDAPLTVSPMCRLVRYREVPTDLMPYLETWDKSFRDWGSSAIDLLEPWSTAPAEVPYFKLARADDAADRDIIQPWGKRFQGKVLVLIDASNSSATFQFAQNIQNHHLGILIGQPTGGSQRGINGGAFFFLRLPHSGLEFDLPLIGTFPLTPAPDAGISPEMVVNTNPLDIANAKDVILEAALRATR